MMIKRIRLCSRGIFLDILLVVTLLFICVVFYRQYRKTHPYRQTISQSDEHLYDEFQEASVAAKKKALLPSSGSKTMLQVEQMLRVEKTDSVHDVRSDDCKGRSYSRGVELVALVVHFFDYEFYDLKNTLSSCTRGESDLIGEIIVVDDGSTLRHISDEAKQFFGNMKPVVKLIKSGLHEGGAKARAVGLYAVTVSLVVFLDSNVICSPGWLKPLVDVLTKHADKSHLFVLPHHDRILHPVSLEYERINRRTRASLSLGLSVRMLPSPDKVEPDGLYRSTVMRGNIFATTKEYMMRIGLFDIELDEGGGEVVELSMRGWMCGGRILTNPCSRVGIINLNQKVIISSGSNLQRIANMWFGSGATPILTLAGSSDLAKPLNESKSRSIQTRLQWIHSSLKCKDINWFINEVLGLNIVPTTDVFKFGLLRAESDAYARVASDSKMELVNMPESGAITKMEFIFELTQTGLLTNNGRCATALKSAQILLEECRPGDRQQKWMYSDTTLINVWSRLCATHVTDPDARGNGRQIIMIQECKSSKQEQDKFKRWNFVEL